MKKFTDKEKSEIHARALKEFEAIQDKERDERTQGVEDLRFVHVAGAQSTESQNFDKRKDVYRGEVNRLAGLVDQVTGGQRENRMGIKYLATGSNPDPKAADIQSGIFRNIDNLSDADNKRDNAFNENVTCGWGGWGLITEFVPGTFEKMPKYREIKSAVTSLYFHVDAKEYTKKDAPSAFLTSSIHPDTFKVKYPNATTTEFNVDQYAKDWITKDDILLAEYWWKEKKNTTIAQMTDGSVIDLGQEKAVLDELAAKGITIAKRANGEDMTRIDEDSHTVYMAIMNGVEFLTDPQEFPSKYIPLFPEFGRTVTIENQTYTRGLARFAKDAQMNYNYETSNQIQIGAESMDDPIFVTAAMAKGHVTELQNLKVDRPPVVILEHDQNVPNGPKRLGAPAVQTMAMARIKQSEMDIYATTNMYPPSLGLNVGLESGVALKHQDEKGDRGSYVFVDNHMKTMKHSAEVMDDILSNIITTQRAMDVLNIDGTVENVMVNEAQFDDMGMAILDEQTGKEVIVNDLRPNFRTTVDISKAYSTRKEESFTELTELAVSDPSFMAISTDLRAKNANTLDSDELHKRARKMMIQQGIIEPSEDEVKELGLDQPQQPDPNTQALTDNIAMDTVLKQTQVELNDIKVDSEIAKNIKSANDSYNALLDAQQKSVESGIPLTPNDFQARNDALAVIEIVQSAVKIPG